MLWSVDIYPRVSSYIAEHASLDVQAVHTDILRLYVSPNRLPPEAELEPEDDGFYLWHIHGHTLLLRQIVTPINGESKTTTEVLIMLIGDAIRGASGVAFLRMMLGI